MVQKLFEANVLIYVMLGFCVLGVAIKFVVYFAYKRLIKASDNIANSKNKLMKMLRLKFETCYKLKIGMNNVDAFVDKYVYKYRVGGILLSTWENASGQVLITCLLIGSVGAVLGVVKECGKVDILSTVFFGVLTSGILILIENLMNLHTKRALLKVGIKDFLENYLKARLENEYMEPEMLQQYQNEYFAAEPKEGIREDGDDVKELMESIEAMAAEHVKDELDKKTKKTKSFELSKSDEKIIEEILKEYLI